ncbi:MAG: ROK family protein, partial [Candidatus Caldatribacteriaceae bacterium]
VPGFLFKNTQMVENSPFAGWENTDVEMVFASLSPYPVTIDNVARASAMAEILYGWGRTFLSFFYFYLDWGTGGGVVYRGRIVRGLNGSCGEIGHTTIDPEGVLCYCGNRGCLEQYTSTAAILRALKEEEGREVNFAEVIARYLQGDPIVVNVLRRAGYFLGKGIANVINLLNPQAVVLGGELSQRFLIYVEEAIASARENIFSLAAQETPIVTSKVGKEEVVLAVAQMMLTRYLEQTG